MRTAGSPRRAAPEPLPVTTAYDLAASSYDAWPWQAFWRRYEFPVVRDALERPVRGGRDAPAMLDLGCGTGWYLERLRSLAGETVGMDASPGMLAVARRRLPAATLLEADARSIPFRARRFGVVLCTRVLSHLPQVGPALGEIARVLAPGGVLILSDVDADHDYEFTRLPAPDGRVPVSTFKHPRDEVFADLRGRGFVRGSSYDLHLDGAVSPVRVGRRRSGPPVVGWVGVWRRDGSVPG